MNIQNSDTIERIVGGAWIGDPFGRIFAGKLDGLRKRIGPDGGLILVMETSPIDFLAVFFAAVLSGRPVALGNAGWGRSELDRAMSALGVSPDACERVSASIASVSAGETAEAGEILIPTGGSGGRLRFARHSWDTLSASGLGFSSFFGGHPVRSLCVLPFSHVSGLMQAIRAIVSGGEIFLSDWKRIRKGDIPGLAEGFFLSLVPTQLQRLLAVEALHIWLRSAEAIPIGGAAPPPVLLNRAAHLGLRVVLTYGATETAAMATAQDPSQFLLGDRTSGRALPHVTVRVVGATGGDAPAGETGRIRVSGTSLFKGYIPEEGLPGMEWDSGDFGFLAEDGRLTVLGREDRAIITGGEKVFPEEIERLLAASGFVEDVVVFGLEDNEWGMAVSAAYVPAPGVTPGQLSAAVKDELAAFKAPRRWLALPAIPRNANGKVDLKRLRSLISET